MRKASPLKIAPLSNLIQLRIATAFTLWHLCLFAPLRFGDLLVFDNRVGPAVDVEGDLIAFTLERMHHALYVKRREQDDPEASPTAGIVDSQSASETPRRLGVNTPSHICSDPDT